MESKKLNDLTGGRFERLAVVARAKSTNGRTMWVCDCDCGNQVKVQGAHLRSGSIKSCGCLRKERMREVQKLSTGHTTHGMAHTREYKSWEQMRQRCLNPKHHAWKWYGGKGIGICQRWLDSFENFYADMGPRPDGCEIDRIDPDASYAPENCRWLERQANGQRAFNKLKEARV